MICIGYNQHAVLVPHITKSIFRWETTWVFITLTNDDVENILNH